MGTHHCSSHISIVTVPVSPFRLRIPRTTQAPLASSLSRSAFISSLPSRLASPLSPLRSRRPLSSAPGSSSLPASPFFHFSRDGSSTNLLPANPSSRLPSGEDSSTVASLALATQRVLSPRHEYSNYRHRHEPRRRTRHLWRHRPTRCLRRGAVRGRGRCAASAVARAVR